jgi:hypothetical protein
MQKKLVLSGGVLITAFGLFGAAAPEVGGAPATSLTAAPAPSVVKKLPPGAQAMALDKCRGAPASATAMLGNDKNTVKLQSNGRNWGSDEPTLCDAFVADFAVPANSQPPPGWTKPVMPGGGGAVAGIKEPNCSALNASVTFYKKVASGEMTRIGGGKLVGHWNPPCSTGFCPDGNTCTLKAASNFKNVVEAPANVASTYRVAVSVKNGQARLPVSAWLSRQQSPPE